MIKKVIMILSFVFVSYIFSFAQDPMENFENDHSPNFLTQDLEQGVNTNSNPNQTIEDPLREGAYKVVHGKTTNKKLKGIIYNDKEIKNFDDAKSGTVALVKKGVNYALGLVSLVALIFLLYHGFLMLTAAGDESQYEKGFKGLRTATIALVGMGLSWLIVSFIFYLLGKIV